MKIRTHRHYGAFWINIWVGRANTAILGLRFGRPAFRLFSERYQGQRGLPVRWHYALGGRIAVRTGRCSS